MINDIILSPPFSNFYPNIEGTTKIVGTYTLKKRSGLWRNLTTLKKTKNGWSNNAGLRNPGILKLNRNNVIVSISLEEESDWAEIFVFLKENIEKLNIQGIEFNISCPNHNVSNINKNILEDAYNICKNISIKTPHDVDIKILEELAENEMSILHISNSKKQENYAISGKSLMYNNLKNISYVKRKYPNTKVIGGGGIYDLNDLIYYRNAGADYYSLSTALINPYKSYKIIKAYREIFS